MKARTIKYFFSGTLLMTALLMSAYSCAGISTFEARDKYQLFAVQIEQGYLIDKQALHNENYSMSGCSNLSAKKQRKEVSWTSWLTNSDNSSFHFLNLLELIGI